MASDGRFTDAEHRQILDAIGAAERLTSGEIRLFVEDVCGENVLDRAAYIFHELKMDRTAERNGVLFYLALEARQFAILGDAGINRKVPEDFWHSIKLEMEHRFALGEFVTGLSTASNARAQPWRNTSRANTMTRTSCPTRSSMAAN